MVPDSQLYHHCPSTSFYQGKDSETQVSIFPHEQEGKQEPVTYTLYQVYIPWTPKYFSGLMYPIFAIFTGSEQSFQKSLQSKSSSITGKVKENQQELLLKKMLLKLQQYFCWFWCSWKGAKEGNGMSVRQYLFFCCVCFTLLLFETATMIFIPFFFPPPWICPFSLKNNSQNKHLEKCLQTLYKISFLKTWKKNL